MKAPSARSGVDLPHPAAESDTDAPPTTTGERLSQQELSDALREQLARQAAELTERLEREAGCVDRREAQLHARLAELEQEIRSATLWLSDQRAELVRRSEELDARERAVSEREANIRSAERYLDAARRRTEERLAELTAADNDGNDDAVADEIAATPDTASAGHWLHIERAWSELRARQDRLAEAERIAEERFAQLETQRLQVLNQARQARAELGRQREDLKLRVGSARQNLVRRWKTLDERRGALDRLHKQVKSRYRDALRVRLATERLCDQAVGPEGAALLLRAAAEARLQLEELNRREDADLTRREEAIATARRDLAARQAEFTAQQAASQTA